MSAIGEDAEEPMDLSDNTEVPQQPKTPESSAEASMVSSQDEDEVLVTLSLKWSESARPKKWKLYIEQFLQTWFNKSKIGADCSVVKTVEDGRVVIKIKPAPAVTELQKLNGQTLEGKSGKNRNSVTIISVSLTPPELNTQPEHASKNLLPSLAETQPVQPEELSSCAISPAGEETCSFPVPLSHFWYVNHIYKEELQRIAKENGMKMTPEVRVTFEAEQKGGDRQKAVSDFINLVQKCLAESSGSVIPLENVDSHQWSDALKIIKKNENKLLVTLSSGDITVCGPRDSQDMIKRSLNASETTNAATSPENDEWETQDTPLKVNMTIKDPLVDGGLTVEKNYWKLMTTSFKEKMESIKDKFGVNFKESHADQGQVVVKACYKRPGGNVSMESHAVRALLRLYQKIIASPMSLAAPSLKNVSGVYRAEGASNGPVLNGQSADSTEASTEGGATAADNNNETCPICLDIFTNKKQLKCTHEFCEKCLEYAKKVLGPICPVCKDVFGLIEGDQPNGSMTWLTIPTCLPGFSNCASIVITYDIPSGRQMERHPKPGQMYSGICRSAYLPDNNEGRKVLRLLKRAFDQKLIFTVGTSRTTGCDNQVTWNDIHHKTSMTGGPECFGYPDPNYLSRVTEELKDKGIE